MDNFFKQPGIVTLLQNLNGLGGHFLDYRMELIAALKAKLPIRQSGPFPMRQLSILQTNWIKASIADIV